MNSFSKKALSVLFLLLFIQIFLIPLVAAQCPPGPDGSPVCPTSGIIQANELLTRLINISVTLAFMALTVWSVWNALKLFITSGGDPKALSHAWSALTWSFMGLFFMVLAYLVLKLIYALTGADVTSYCLGFPPYCIDTTIPMPPFRDPNS